MQVVDKLDFSSWDVVAKDVAAELVSHAALGGAKLGPDGSGLSILLCTMAQLSIEAVGMDDSVTEKERLQRAESGLSR
jgi:hypothetical protein|eukprot:COSAG03_NODE_114_length_12445_cov_68.628382_1_plen_78_part_00